MPCRAICISFGVVCVCAMGGIAGAQSAVVTGSSGGARPRAEIVLPGVDPQEYVTEDREREALGLPARFAIPNETFVTPTLDGVWADVDHQTRRWRLNVAAPRALSLNFGFTRFELPPSAALRLYKHDGALVHGPFTAADNRADGQFWTPIVPGDAATIEVTLPPGEEEALILELTRVSAGYRGFGAVLRGEPGPRSDYCEVDVACPEGDQWRAEIQSVVLLSLGGFGVCSGALVNNTSGNRVPYVLTANHCLSTQSEAAATVAYFNFQASECDGPRDGSFSQFVIGADLRATYFGTDFTLLELDKRPPDAYKAAWAGWERTMAAPSSAVGIHHPNGDEKAISIEYDACSLSAAFSYATNASGGFIRIPDWDVGVTEPGSSGSPLFNQSHRVVGQLLGGSSFCGFDGGSDWYGWVAMSWDGGGTPDSRLSDWLDPQDKGDMSVATLYAGSGVDCDNNSVSDDVEILQSPALDCNRNGILDICEPNPAFGIVKQPLSLATCLGGSASFTVLAAGDTINYQWRHNGASVLGATNATYTIPNVQQADLGSYDVVVTTSGLCAGSVTSQTASLVLGDGAQIVGQPVGGSACEGGFIILNVEAGGTPPLTYTWRKNGVIVATGYDPSLTLGPLTIADSGAYDVLVSNGCRVAESAATDVTVNYCAAPAAPRNPSPVSPGVDIGVDPVLRWEAAQRTRVYEIHFGTTSPPPAIAVTSETKWDFTAPLLAGKTYFWQIVAINEVDRTASPIWTFTTLPEKPETALLVNAAPDASDMPLDVQLVWIAAGRAEFYQVLLGTSPDSLKLLGTTRETSWGLTSLQPGTTYYWQVLARNSAAATASDVRKFTTRAALPSEINENENSSVNDNATNDNTTITNDNQSDQVDPNQLDGGAQALCPVASTMLTLGAVAGLWLTQPRGRRERRRPIRKAVR